MLFRLHYKVSNLNRFLVVDGWFSYLLNLMMTMIVKCLNTNYVAHQEVCGFLITKFRWCVEILQKYIYHSAL